MNPIGINQLPENSAQPVTVINNIYNYPPKSDEKGYQPGQVLYYALEGTIQNAMFSRCVSIADTCTPIYTTTYAVAFVAGAAFGLYKAMKGERNVGINERAQAFVDGGFGTKVTMMAELALQGPIAIAAADMIETSGRSISGGLVAAAWGFTLGADLSTWAYKSIKNKEQE